MKTRIQYAGIIAAVALTLGFSSCKSGSEPEVKENIEEVKQDHTDDEKIKQEIALEREQFNAEVNARIEQNKKDIEEMKERLKTEKKAMREKYEASISDLEKRNDELKARLDNDKEESKDKWDRFKAEFNHDMDELGHSISDLFKDNVK